MRHRKLLVFIILLSVLIIPDLFAGEKNTTGDTHKIQKVTRIPVTSKFLHIPIKSPAHALTNNGKNIIYGTIDGFIYALDSATKVSMKLYDVGSGTNLLIGGLSHIGDSRYIYSSIRENRIKRLDIHTGKTDNIANIKLADGLDIYNNKIYSVTYNKSDLLTVFDMNGTQLYTLSTEIGDMVAIAHSDKYLYILSEDCNIYQTDPGTGKSRMIIRTDDNFEKRDSFGGAEGIDIFDNHIYLSNVDDSSICRSDLDIRSFESGE
jgi:hypothetical protein